MDDLNVFQWGSSEKLGEPAGSYISSLGQTQYRVSSDDVFDRFRRDRGRTQLVAMLTGFGVAFTFLFVVVTVQSNSGKLSTTAWIGPAATIVTVSVLGYVFLATSQLWHLRVRRLSRDAGLATFAIGLTPIGKSYLVIRPDAILIVSKADLLLARISKADVRQIALASGRAGVGLAIGIEDGYLEMPIVLKVAGPTAQGWSIDGWLGQGRLKRALDADLRRNGFPVKDARDLQQTKN
ncbi:hypothetical protein [Diaminobutyricibacter sp. McL0608]|uniref:hypothetical protein n=1 Tax=Leifsonia sp. McL0608 TaxID=3143537 RepID=UPI0031F3369D